MLKPEDIRITVGTKPGYDLCYRADLSLTAVAHVSDLEMRLSTGLLVDKLARENVTKRIFNGVYGDLHKQLLELEHCVMRSVARNPHGTYEEVRHLGEQFSCIRRSLNPS